MINISFSWDDGSIYDIKLATLMKKYNIEATFFIPATNQEHPYINKHEIKEIYELGMDIGGHTYSHVYLTDISKEKVEMEIKNGKEYIEDIIMNEMNFFCYPGGFYNSYISEITKKYFKKARTANTMRFNKQDTFNIDTSFHFYDRGVKSCYKNVIHKDLKIFPKILRSTDFNIFQMYKNILKTLENSSEEYNIHIWGHGWEIEEQNLWDELESLLMYIRDYSLIVKSMRVMYL